MKNKYPLILLTFSIILFSCKKKDDDNNNSVSDPTYGNLKINIIGKHGGDDFVMYNEVVNSDNIAYRVEGLKFYVSNTKLDNESSSDVFLLNFVNNHLQPDSEGESFTVQIKTGSYSNLSFMIGLDSETNHGDPSLYPQNDPLSSFNDTHWDWAQGYKFFITDGKIDSDSDGTPDQSYSYHIGNDDYLKTVSLSANVAITENNTTEVNIYFDVLKVIENIDVNSESFTHSTSNFPLVEKIANNYAQAFSLN